MGLFDFIFGKPIEVENQFFGRMRFVGNKKDPGKNYFECKRFFTPKNDHIEISINGHMEGPTQKQIDFFKNIETNYSEISKSVTILIEDEFRNWKDDFTIKDFNNEFKPVHLFLPSCETQPIVWEIAFESGHDLNHTFTLTMHDFVATEILIDC